MNMRRILNIKGTNLWLLASAVGLNLIYAMVFLAVGYFWIIAKQGITLWIELFLVLGVFLGPFLIGLLITFWAGDGRGPTYSVYGSLGGLAPVAVVGLPGGMFGILLVLFLLLGGLNGGLFGEYLRHRGDKPPPRP